MGIKAEDISRARLDLILTGGPITKLSQEQKYNLKNERIELGYGEEQSRTIFQSIREIPERIQDWKKNRSRMRIAIAERHEVGIITDKEIKNYQEKLYSRILSITTPTIEEQYNLYTKYPPFSSILTDYPNSIVKSLIEIEARATLGLKEPVTHLSYPGTETIRPESA